MSKIITADDNSFVKEVVDSTGPVLVDFSAAWCGPCHRLSAVLEEFSNSSNIKIVKVDIDDAPETTSKFKIKGVPTLMLFNDGNIINTKTGFMPLNELNNFISKF